MSQGPLDLFLDPLSRGGGVAQKERQRRTRTAIQSLFELIRYATYLAGLPALLFGALAAADYGLQALCVAGLAIGAGAYLRTPYHRLARLWGSYGLADRLQALGLVPIIRVVGDVAKMAGYPAGVAWRRKRIASQPELRWRDSS